MRPRAAELRSAAARLGEAFVVADDVIGRHDQHDRIGMFMRRSNGGDRDRRRGIAAHGLEDDVGDNADLRQLFGDDEARIQIGDDERLAEDRRIADALRRSLKSRVLAEQRNELLRHAFT